MMMPRKIGYVCECSQYIFEFIPEELDKEFKDIQYEFSEIDGVAIIWRKCSNFEQEIAGNEILKETENFVAININKRM